MTPGPARAFAPAVPDRTILLGAPLLLPWTVVPGAGISLVFPWGLVSAWPLPVVVVPLFRYLGPLTAGLPGYLQAWPASVFLYACALASTIQYIRPPMDDDGTAALLGLAGLAHLLVAVGLWRTGRVAAPLGTAVLWALAYAVYRTPTSEPADVAGGGG